jgi:hypothetical protein
VHFLAGINVSASSVVVDAAKCSDLPTLCASLCIHRNMHSVCADALHYAPYRYDCVVLLTRASPYLSFNDAF